MLSILKTAGISRALAKIAECEVLPPTSVIIPEIFSLIIPAVMDGVKSLATITLPAGRALIFTSSTPSRVLISLVFISRRSAARWTVNSSPVASNIEAKPSKTCSVAASEVSPPLIPSLTSSVIAGSLIISTCPIRISDSLSPTLFRISSAIFSVL